MKFKYCQELVLQIPGDSIKDYDAMIDLENRIVAGLDTLGEVDGHDMGMGEMNIFIHTDHPKLAFEKLKPILWMEGFPLEFKAAYRDVGKDNYTILHPPGLSHFAIA